MIQVHSFSHHVAIASWIVVMMIGNPWFLKSQISIQYNLRICRVKTVINFPPTCYNKTINTFTEVKKIGWFRKAGKYE